MNEQDLKITNIDFRKPQLTDLNAIINIYKKQNKQTDTSKLTTHFGLPLIIATKNNEIISYAAASINELEQIKLNLYFAKHADNLLIGTKLEEQAERTLHSTYKNIGKDYNGLKKSINQLVVWLNKCSV